MPAAGDPAERGIGSPDHVLDLLAAAVRAVSGTSRTGQQQMAAVVERALADGEHLLVQAGTGTGKSLGYLVPGLARAIDTGKPVVVSTATLALQAQIVGRDLPRVADALAPLLGRRPTWQLVKGRRNYLCRHKLAGGFPADDGLFELSAPEDAAARGPSSRLGAEILRLREWAATTASGDRDDLVPGVSERAWRQVSVGPHECLGSQRCPLAAECHVEIARERAREVDVVVSNHAFVAIDAFEGRAMLPDHDALIVDEGHELSDRVTSVITDELSPPMVEVAAARARRAGIDDVANLQLAADTLAAVLEGVAPGRFDSGLPDGLRAAVSTGRDAARAVLSALGARGSDEAAGPGEGTRQVARAAVSEVFDVSERLVAAADGDVLWASRARRPDGTERTTLHAAPLSVAGLLRARLYPDRTVVLTSATLTVGGDFEATATAVGLGTGEPAWRGIDVGSPFDYSRQAMLYVARRLPAPGRDGPTPQMLDELAELITAAGGRTLGLFSSRRAAITAADAMRDRMDLPILCQGEDTTNTLVRQFAADAQTCLFGTLSLWQGVDVPGPSCQLVVIDRIPFPRPDDPLASARSLAVSRAGGNGFMAVAATHAALRLAQGSGRLIRSGADRGVVAVLDPRLATARYGSFLRASLPPFWPTADKAVVLDALRRIDAAATQPGSDTRTALTSSP